jgi:hypothetical protein
MAYLDFQHSSRVYLIASDGTSGHDAAIGVVMQFHQITDEITHIALLQPDRSETSVQRRGNPSNRLLHLGLESRCDLCDSLQRWLVLCD